MKKKNAGYSFHPGLLSGKQQRLRGSLPYNRRVASMMRKARGSGTKPSRSTSQQELISALTNLGYKKPVAKAAAQRASGSDFDSMLRSALGSLKRNPMSKKKKTKKNNSRKGKMPAGLAEYWRKKRAQKNARKAKRRKRPNPKKKRTRRRKPVAARRQRVRNYRKPARRKRRSNPPRKRPVKIIKTTLRKGTKAFRQFVAEQRAKYGKARVL